MYSSGLDILEHPYTTYLPAPPPPRTPAAKEIPEKILRFPTDRQGTTQNFIFPDLYPPQAIPCRYEYVGLGRLGWDYLHHLGICI